MSMPSIAAQLDVGVTSIYWYFRNKDDLLQQMRALATRELIDSLPSQEERDPAQWRSYFFELFNRTRALYSEDDVTAELILLRHNDGDSPATALVYESVETDLVYLMQAGFSAESAWNLYATLSMYTHNVAATERKRRATNFPPQGDEQLHLLDRESTPTLARLVEEHSVSLDFTGSTFEPGLNLILDSAELRLKQEG